MKYIALTTSLLITCFIWFKIGQLHGGYKVYKTVVIRNEPIKVPLGSRIYASFDGKYFIKLDSITEKSDDVTMPVYCKVLKIVK